MTIDPFDSFVEQQQQEAREQGFSSEDRIALWQKKVNELNSFAMVVFHPYLQESKIRMHTESFETSEESLGRYQTHKLFIDIGNSKIVLEPIGTMIVGARGRVDVTGPKGVVRLLLLPKQTTSPRVTVHISRPGEMPPRPEAPPPMEDDVWKIATRPPRIEYQELTPDVFKDVVMNVVNG